MHVYLWICFWIFTALAIIGLVEDIIKGPDIRFGYNMTNGMFWFLVALFCVPFLNIIFALLILWATCKGALK